MKAKAIGYWVATALTALLFSYSGVIDLTRATAVVEGLAHLGYPAYFPLILGGWKVLGVAAVLVPGFPTLKEWAYAGMAFDLSGAAMSHAASGDDTAKVITPLVLLGVVAASWALRPNTRRLGAPARSRIDHEALGSKLPAV